MLPQVTVLVSTLGSWWLARGLTAGVETRLFLVALKITPQRRFWESVGKMVLGEWWRFSSVSGGAAEASAVLA